MIITKKKEKFTKRRLKELIFYICLLVVPITQFCVFYIGVNIKSVMLAFQTYNYDLGVYEFSGLVNFNRIYTMLTTSDILSKAVVNSLVLYAVGLGVGLTLSLLFSFYIYKKRWGSKLFKVMLFMPSMIPSIAMVIMFKYTAERALPEAINALFKTNLTGLLSHYPATFPLLVFYTIWVSFGSGVLMYTGAMANISDSIVESARIEGATLAQEFFRITLPLIFPTITTFLVVGIAGIFTNQMSLYSFFGARAEPRLYTLGYFLFKDLRNQNLALGETPFLAAMGIVLTLIAAPVTLLARKLLVTFGPKTN